MNNRKEPVLSHNSKPEPGFTFHEKTELVHALNVLRLDNTQKQKRGIHFIIASVFIWIAISIIHASSLPILTKNLFTFCCSAPLVPLAYLFSRLLKIDFQNKGNPLSGLGLLFALNQMLYILIAMWVYSAVPEKMLMVYTMIFGAHLLPYGWLYRSLSYFVYAILIPIGTLLLGILFPPIVIAVFMLIAEIVFCLLLTLENNIYSRKSAD